MRLPNEPSDLAAPSARCERGNAVGRRGLLVQIGTLIDSQYGLDIYTTPPAFTKQMHTPTDKGQGSWPRTEPGEIAMQASISVLSPVDVGKI